MWYLIQLDRMIQRKFSRTNIFVIKKLCVSSSNFSCVYFRIFQTAFQKIKQFDFEILENNAKNCHIFKKLCNSLENLLFNIFCKYNQVYINKLYMYTLNRPQSREIFIIRCWEEAMGYNNFSLTVGQAIFSSMNRFYGKFKKGRVGFIDKTMRWMKT